MISKSPPPGDYIPASARRTAGHHKIGRYKGRQERRAKTYNASIACPGSIVPSLNRSDPITFPEADASCRRVKTASASLGQDLDDLGMDIVQAECAGIDSPFAIKSIHPRTEKRETLRKGRERERE